MTPQMNELYELAKAKIISGVASMSIFVSHNALQLYVPDTLHVEILRQPLTSRYPGRNVALGFWEFQQLS